MPSWSPDNDTLVFTSDAGGMSSQALLWTVRRSGGAPVPLTRGGSPPGGHLAPSWSTGGRFIVFTVGQHSMADLWIIDASGGEPWRVRPDVGPPRHGVAPTDHRMGARFSPNDRAVYWIGYTAEGTQCMMRVAITRAGKPDGDAELVTTFVGQTVSGLSIARDGTTVVEMSEAATNLFAVDLNAPDAAPIQLTSDEVRNTLPDFGPQGRIAFEQQVVGRPVAAWTMSDDGTRKELLSHGTSASVRAPQWDRDGTRLFVVLTNAGSERQSFGWLEVGTRRLQHLALDVSSSGSPPHLSPDGELLAFHRIAADGAMNVWIQRVDGSPPRQVTFDSEAMSYPRWSQDGRWLTVVIKRGDRTHVGVVPAEGGPVEQLTAESGQSWPYSWSRDNRLVAYAGQRDGVWNIYTVSRDSRQVRPLTRFSTPEGYVRYPAWSPRDDRIVFERGETKGSLWTLKLPS